MKYLFFLLLISSFALAQVDVTLPIIQRNVGSADELFTIDANNLAGKQVNSFQFTLFYDNSVISLTSASVSGLITSGGLFVANPDTAKGKITVAWAQGTPLNGQGALVKISIKFKKEGTSILTFRNDKGENTFIFNAGNPAAIVNEGNVVIGTPSTSLNLLYPDGGEKLIIGTTDSVIWNSSSVNELKIELSSDNGSTWTVLTNSFSALHKKYTYMVPNLPTDKALVRITSSDNPLLKDISSLPFTIMEAPSINLIHPDGGETWHVNSTQKILWSSINIDEITIDYSTDNGTTWITITNGISAETKSYDWLIPDTPTIQALVRISSKSNYIVNDISNSTFMIDRSTDAEGSNFPPYEFKLLQNFPNPFNPSTTISYSLPIESFVVIKLFDTIGNEVTTLVNEMKSAGAHYFAVEADKLISGIYIYRMNTNDFSSSKKLLVIK